MYISFISGLYPFLSSLSCHCGSLRCNGDVFDFRVCYCEMYILKLLDIVQVETIC